MLNRVSTMSSTCPECEMRFTRRDNMKRHFNSRHENMKFIPPPPPKENGYDCTAPPLPLPKETGYDYTPPTTPPKETDYDYAPPPPPPLLKETGYDYAPPPPRGPELSLQHQTETEEPYFILKTNNPFFVLGSGRKRSRSLHAMGASVYQCDLGIYR